MRKILIALLLAMAACNPYTSPPTYEQTLTQIMESCKSDMDSGKYATLSAMLSDCQKDQTIEAFIFHKGSRDLDIITQTLDYEIQVARDLENHKITEDQATQRLENFTSKQVKKALARQQEHAAAVQREAEQAEKEREAKANRLADYYRKNPHEYQKFLQQQRQLELLEEQNRLLAEQKAQRQPDEGNQELSRGLGSFADSLGRRSSHAPVNCNTSYGSSSSTTTCY